MVDITKPSVFLAVLVGISQFFQAKLSMPKLPEPSTKKENPSFQEEFAKSMQLQMKYFMPVFIGFIATKLNAAISLYWITNNVVSIFHELFVKNKAKDIKS